MLDIGQPPFDFPAFVDGRPLHTDARIEVRYPFTGDLDIFGRASLMQLVDATETRFGEERLAGMLSLESPTGWPDAVTERQEAVRDLSGRFAFREALAMAGGVLAGEPLDPGPLVAWSEAHDELPPALRRVHLQRPAAQDTRCIET